MRTIRIERWKSKELNIFVYSIRDMDTFEIIDGSYSLTEAKRLAKTYNCNIEPKIHITKY